LRPILEDRGRNTESTGILVYGRQNETEMFSHQDRMSPSIAAVSAPSTACSLLTTTTTITTTTTTTTITTTTHKVVHNA